MTAHDVLVAGECLVDLYPTDDDSAVGHETFQRRAGGAPANVAVALGKLDAPPLFWTSIGDDSFGDHLTSVLGQASIPSRFVHRRADDSTGLVLVDEAVEGGFELYLDGTATVEFDITDLPETLFAELEWVHLGGVLLAREPARSAMFELLERAGNHECTISFDPNTRPSIWPSTEECVDALDRVVREVDVVVGHTEDFPDEAFPSDPTALSDELLDRGPMAIALTKGADGAEITTCADSPWGECNCKHPGFEVSVVDTTGAGDAFTATLIRGLREADTPITEALRLANASGAIATTRTGAIAALPDRATVNAWLQARDAQES
jgi:fructokinase